MSGCSSLKVEVCVCFFQVTVTPRRAAPSSTAVMPPRRRASSMTAKTWPCLRYGPVFCTHTLNQAQSQEAGYTHCHNSVIE